MGVIVSTLLIQFYGWTGFDPIASLFIAILIAASVIPLVIDSGKILGLDVGEKQQSVEIALDEVKLLLLLFFKFVFRLLISISCGKKNLRPPFLS